MAELFEQVVSVLEARSSTRSLAGQYRINSEQAAGNAAVLAVPVFVAELAKRTNDPSQSIAVLKVLRNINTVGLQNLGVTIESRLYEPIGSELTELLLGDRRAEVAAVVSGEAGIGQRSASSLLPPTAWAVVAHIADRHGNRIDRQSLAAILNREREELIHSGWGPWLQATTNHAINVGSATPSVDPAPDANGFGAQPENVASADDVFDRAWGALAQDTPAKSSDQRARPRAGSDALIDDGVVAGTAAASAAAEPAAQVTRVSESNPVRRSARGRGRGRARTFRRVAQMVVGAAVFFGVVAGAVYWLVVRDESDLGTAAVESTSAVAAEASNTGEAVDQEQVSADTAAAFPELDLTPVDVSLTDPTGQSSATGVAELRFDKPAAKICYSIEVDQTGQPLDGHLRAGAQGAEGDVLVTLGRFTSPAIGCVDTPSSEMETMLSAPGEHYVELVDPSTGLVLRAQLSENTADHSS